MGGNRAVTQILAALGLYGDVHWITDVDVVAQPVDLWAAGGRKGSILRCPPAIHQSIGWLRRLTRAAPPDCADWSVDRVEEMREIARGEALVRCTGQKATRQKSRREPWEKNALLLRASVMKCVRRATHICQVISQSQGMTALSFTLPAACLVR
jgi:hypothetical protein